MSSKSALKFDGELPSLRNQIKSIKAMNFKIEETKTKKINNKRNKNVIKSNL